MKSLRHKLRHERRFQQTVTIVVVLVIAAIGVYTLSGSRALSNYFAGEAENGQLANGATTQTDSAASDGRYVQFGTGTVTQGPNPLVGLTLYRDPFTQAASAEQSASPTDAALLHKITSQPIGKWFSQNWLSIKDSTTQVVQAANAQGAVAQIILYDIPSRDCGQFSSGGAANSDAYKSEINDVATAIGSSRAIIILEPDALAQLDGTRPDGSPCLTAAQQQDRLDTLSFAIQRLKQNQGTVVYIDAGQYTWQPVDKMVTRLTAAGVSHADGFSLNVSSFGWSTRSDPGWVATPSTATHQINYQSNQEYGDQISAKIGGKHFVIDTSRNGLGPSLDLISDDPAVSSQWWCNPTGRALGHPPLIAPVSSDPLIDAYMWLKQPGESDGTCKGGPSAGTFWLDYALGLAQRQPNY